MFLHVYSPNSQWSFSSNLSKQTPDNIHEYFNNIGWVFQHSLNCLPWLEAFSAHLLCDPLTVKVKERVSVIIAEHLKDKITEPQHHKTNWAWTLLKVSKYYMFIDCNYYVSVYLNLVAQNLNHRARTLRANPVKAAQRKRVLLHFSCSVISSEVMHLFS